MFGISQQSHNQFVLRSSRQADQERRKFSAGYKRRNKSDREKEKERSNSKLLHYPSEEVRNKKNPLPQDLSSCLRKQSFSGLEEKGANLGGSQRVEGGQKNQQFSIIMESIKDVLKSNERQSQQAREVREFRGKFNLKDEFLCLRSKLHQQLYKRDDYRSKEFEQSLLEMKRYTRQDTSSSVKKYVCNPFMAAHTVVCNSAVLNEPLPLPLKRPQPEGAVAVSRSFCSRRTPQVGQVQRRSFQVSVKEGDDSYSKKIKNYLQFLFKVNFSNSLYVQLGIRYEEGASWPRAKVYIGPGNNAALVKSIVKRRFWWEVAGSIDQPGINFYWTQGRLEAVLARQKPAEPRTATPTILGRKPVRVGEEALRLNRKVLSEGKAALVEQYISGEGFFVPYEQVFVADVLTNHLPRNDAIGSKKHLFKSLFCYYSQVAHKDPFEFLPKTYHIPSRESAQFRAFLEENGEEPGKVWIVKPGENTNRGRAIELCEFGRVGERMVHEKHSNGEPFTYIVQSYINRPFLYHGRKFDIRHFLLVTSVGGALKGYWYAEGYLRTSSEPFELGSASRFVHLTNDAVQRQGEHYERHEAANKLSYSQFQRYLDAAHPTRGYHFARDLLPRMKGMALDLLRANCRALDPRRHSNNFEVFGLDFMVDREWRPWLIEANYNPCLEVNCPVLERVIPGMLESSLRVALDPLFPPPCHFPSGKRFYLSDHYLRNLKYELIFDQEASSHPQEQAERPPPSD